ncbi:MAG: tetratricopeptide repeat protein [Acidobacteria bacterium]|nr:tetratricopeptide repeat protein [Acidobacteriota bacterium]
MKTIRTMAMVSLLLVLTSCASLEEAKRKKQERESYANPFYLKYLDEGSRLDKEILLRIDALRADPTSPEMHNELGALLFDRRFPKDARYEFERALHFDKRFYSARYNLAILELAEGNSGRARRLLKEVVNQKPGHAEAHFTLGLIYEKSGRTSAAIDHYAKAYTIDPDMLKIRRNPRLVETELVTATLLELYDSRSARASVKFLAAPDGYEAPKPKEEEREPVLGLPEPIEPPASPPSQSPGR